MSAPAGDAVAFPTRLPVAGIQVSATTYAEATAAIIAAARARRPTLVSALAVHGLTVGATDPALAEALNQFDIVTPDGQPVRWALNLLHGAGLTDRVYGPQRTLDVCAAAARTGVGVYLYGSRPEVGERMAANLCRRFPGLRVVGRRASRFRPATPEEDADDVRDIRESGAGIVLVGLGCPRQERWAFDHRDRIDAAILCVGAAFDFHAGTLKQAPGWMQRRGLEWLFRLGMEPRRLWHRYLTTNPLFVRMVLGQLVAQRLRPAAAQ